jgi:hypothetical protein
MGLFDNIFERIGQSTAYWLMQNNPIAVRQREYYSGRKSKQLVVKQGKTDDNILANLVGLAVDRSVAHTLAGGVEFDLGEGMEAQQEYLDNVWDANQEDLLLTDAVINGSVYGTGYIKIVPDGIQDLYTDATFPRLIVLNPEYLSVETDDHDSSKVESYIVTYTISDDDGATVYRETTSRANENDAADTEEYQADTWVVVFEKKRDLVSGVNWELISKTGWPYDFPPIIHWKNQPSLNNVFGSSDLDDIILLQDKNNFVLSNLQKMVRLQAHKQMWGRGIGDKDLLNVGPDQLIKLSGDKAELGFLDLTADITGSLAYAQQLRQMLFDVTREVDISSITDKLGALTNFGLRVLYSDSMAKVGIKRMLLGAMLTELNRRLLVLSGNEGEASRPGEVVWHDPLPSNRLADAADIAMGIVSKQTISEKRGYVWEDEQQRIQDEKGSQDNAIGAALLRSFPGIGKA